MYEKWHGNELSSRDIEWLLSSDTELFEGEHQSYGDLTALNSGGLIKSAVGPEVLNNIVADFVSLLGTSSAIYEKNGEYAYGIFSSGWCRSLDLASFRLCNTDDLDQALRCGKWLCHESCWTDASKNCIERDETVTIQCHGGLHLCAILYSC